ncbi:leucine-rich repeat protein 1-like isoform X2 [Mercenaria mercenaria]|uniref:leucine-rich repeat protein 1-like isoform X2 n=1 Tax=Mercenaria mercenaria TaxID=6596 RepID=UPI001E1DA9E8|nr:leucine-rich repeat protein 1-like isoform X2 [Mercenaria mercenaria]
MIYYGMRLSCDVDCVNRALATHNLKKAGKSSHAQLSIGRKPGNGPLKENTLYIMLCTAKDRNGTKYPIKDNIMQVFTKFVSEGKATIRLKQPEQDICISKADVIQLKSFLNVLRQALQGKNLDSITLSSLAPASAKNIEKPKTNLVITTKRDYPLTKNFPMSLESLQVSECRMKRIDSRIFNLRNLTRLDLSNNSIEIIPDEISKLQNLSELKLAHNNITIFSPSVCLKESLQKSLNLLDLSNNKIQKLPLQICELVNLVNLKFDNNEMEVLPPTIGRLHRLQFISACNNKLRTLPASFMKLRLDSVDLFGNSFDVIENYQISAGSVDVPTLVECAARSIKKSRVPYSEEDLHLHLCRYLDSARQCWCGNYCFQCSVRYTSKVDLRRVASTVTAVDVQGGTGVPVEGFLCSPQCLKKFQNNPNAYWK